MKRRSRPAKRTAAQVDWEAVFLNHWQMAGDRVQPVREYRFCPGRKFRADFAWPRRKVLLEVEGGVHSRGRHVRALGFMADCKKYNLAAQLGYMVIRVPTPFLADDPLGVVEQVKQVLHARRVPGFRRTQELARARRVMRAGRV